MKKITNKNILLVIITLLIVVIFVNQLLPYNYPTDIYNIFVMGYKKYADTWFITSGRTVCLMAYYLLDFLKIPINTGIFIMKIFAIIICTSCILIFYRIISKEIPKNNKLQKIGTFFATLIVFLNHSSYEFFYYTESAIMWLGVLFVLLAVKIYNDDSPHKYLKIFICLFISINCYQSIILLYIPILILLISINKKIDKKTIKDLIYNILLVAINIIIGYLIVKICRYYNSFEPYRPLTISFSFKNLIYNTKKILIYNSIFPNIVIAFINIFSVIYLCIENIHKKDSKKIIIPILLISLISFLEVLLYTVLTNFYVADRINYAYIASTGLIIIYTLFASKNKLLFTGISIILLLFQIITSFEVSYYSQKTRKTDVIYGERIHNLIEKYEKKNNIKLNKIIYCHDDYLTITYKGYKRSSEETCRGFYSVWILNNIFNYYNKDHDFKSVYNQDIYKEKFKSRNWNDFSEEQLIFEGDTIYLCVY